LEVGVELLLLPMLDFDDFPGAGVLLEDESSFC